jgi:hypothetical protein
MGHEGFATGEEAVGGCGGGAFDGDIVEQAVLPVAAWAVIEAAAILCARYPGRCQAILAWSGTHRTGPGRASSR